MVEQRFRIHLSLTSFLPLVRRCVDAQTHVEHANPHTVNNTCLSAHVTDRQARLWARRDGFEEAQSEALHALDVFEKLGAMDNAGATRQLLRWIDARGAGQPGRQMG